MVGTRRPPSKDTSRTRPYTSRTCLPNRRTFFPHNEFTPSQSPPKTLASFDHSVRLVLPSPGLTTNYRERSQANQRHLFPLSLCLSLCLSLSVSVSFSLSVSLVKDFLLNVI